MSSQAVHQYVAPWDNAIIIWLLHNLVEASFDLFRYLLLGDQLCARITANNGVQADVVHGTNTRVTDSASQHRGKNL